MSKTKRRIKKDPPLMVETPAPTPRQTRVTLTKDVSSRYRKLVPRPLAGLAAKPPRPPRHPDSPHLPEPGERPPKPFRRRDSLDHGGGPLEAMKTLVQRELPEVARQLRETQDLLRDTAEQIMTILESWTGREEPQTARNMVTALFEKMSFHDLAGQRLAKIDQFLKALGDALPANTSSGHLRTRKLFSQTGQAEISGTEVYRSRRNKPFSEMTPVENSENKPNQPRRPKSQPSSEEKKLKGPQAVGGGMNQNEVETLLADLFRQEES